MKKQKIISIILVIFVLITLISTIKPVQAMKENKENETIIIYDDGTKEAVARAATQFICTKIYKRMF